MVKGNPTVLSEKYTCMSLQQCDTTGSLKLMWSRNNRLIWVTHTHAHTHAYTHTRTTHKSAIEKSIARVI